MQININTKEFEKLLSKVNNFIPAHSVNTIYENIKLTIKDYVLALSATDTQIYFEAKMKTEYDGELMLILPPKLLYDTVKNLEDNELVLSVDDDRKKAVIETNNGVYNLSLLSPELYPDTPVITDTSSFKFTEEKLKESFESTVFAAAKEETRLAMSGVLIDMTKTELRFVATDGHRLVRYALPEIKNEIERKIIVPARAVTSLVKILGTGDVDISFNKNFFRVESESFIFMVRLIDEQYPNYDSVIPLENDNILEVDRAKLNKAIKRVSLYTHSATKQIRLLIDNNIMTVSAENMDINSSAKEKVDCEYKSPKIEIAFNWMFLSDLLNNTKSERVVFKMSTPSRACIIEPNINPENTKVTMLVMPMRINT